MKANYEITRVTCRMFEGEWFCEAWDFGKLVMDSQKIHFPVDVEGYGENEAEELEKELSAAFPHADIQFS